MAAIRELSRELDIIEQANQPEHFGLVERTDEMMLKFIDSDDADYLLLEVGGEILGFISVQQQETGPDSGLIPHKFGFAYELIVSNKGRGKGYGQMLLEAAKCWARERDLPYFKLPVLPENQSAMEFYGHNGFKNVLVIMECKLAD